MTSFTAVEARRLILAGDAPAGMHVGGDLDLDGATVAALPETLRVDGDLDLYGTAITILPRGMSVGGDLYLGGTAIAELPRGLRVGDSLYLGGTAITALPRGLRVGGSLYLGGTAITALPQCLSVGGRLMLGNPTALQLPSAWFYNPRKGTRRRLLASDSEYDLIELEDGTFAAGCRGLWSREQALAHWGNPARTDARAKLFVQAILDAPER